MRPVYALMSAFAIVLAGAHANAALVLRITDGTTTIEIADGSANDTSPLTGAVGYSSSVSGTVGGFLSLAALGQSKPAMGSASSPDLFLNISNAATISTAGASILLTDTDFDSDLPSAMLSVTGGTGGRLNARYFGDSENNAFGKEFEIGEFLNLTGDFDETKMESMDDSVGSLTIQWDIAIGVGQSAGATAKLQLLPEPSTTLFLAAGLAGIAYRGRRR